MSDLYLNSPLKSHKSFRCLNCELALNSQKESNTVVWVSFKSEYHTLKNQLFSYNQWVLNSTNNSNKTLLMGQMLSLHEV